MPVKAGASVKGIIPDADDAGWESFLWSGSGGNKGKISDYGQTRRKGDTSDAGAVLEREIREDLTPGESRSWFASSQSDIPPGWTGSW